MNATTAPAATADELRLRPVGEDELPLLAEILAELDGGPVPALDDVRRTWQAMARHPDYHCYFALAQDDGRETVVGTLSLIVFPVLAHGLAAEAIVEAVVVRPAHRGRQYGRAMMRAAMRLAASKGAYKLALSSNLRRLDAHRFYDSLDFARHGYSFSIDLPAADTTHPA